MENRNTVWAPSLAVVQVASSAVVTASAAVCSSARRP